VEKVRKFSYEKGKNMHISLNLKFDRDTEQVIREMVNLMVKDLSGNIAYHLVKYPPHITLAAYKVEDVLLDDTRSFSFLSTFVPLPMQFNAVGVFPSRSGQGPGVIYLAPCLSLDLAWLQRSIIHTCYDMHPSWAIQHDWLLPNHWTPHVTLLKHLAPHQMVEGMKHCLSDWTPIQGYGTEVGLRIHPDVQDYFTYPLRSEISPAISTR
jgi:2'-5' RNA ligase